MSGPHERPYEKRASETEDRDQGPRAGTNNQVPVLKYSKLRDSRMDKSPYYQESKAKQAGVENHSPSSLLKRTPTAPPGTSLEKVSEELGHNLVELGFSYTQAESEELGEIFPSWRRIVWVLDTQAKGKQERARLGAKRAHRGTQHPVTGSRRTSPQPKGVRQTRTSSLQATFRKRQAREVQRNGG
ncbi:hypothetical protein BGZ49_005064 [Haplosporangium sp. Z 27]|nr:hypothetical protein BGZ49_005064 [Haplosporangium sp. Z 27]